MTDRTSPYANRILIGSITVLVLLVAVLLAYNANSGLPFVPVYRLTAVVPDAAELVPGNDVRIGGKRVGEVTSIEAQEAPGGRVSARVHLLLEKTVQPLPVDTGVAVRPRSPLGLKYLDLKPGRSHTGVPSDGTLPVTNASNPVELQDLFNTFDRPTRRGLRGVIDGLGTGLAGRGENLNQAIGHFAPLTAHLRRVARTLRLPGTDLRGFVNGLDTAAAAVAPVAAALAGLFDGAATTLSAVAAARAGVQATLEQAPATEQTTTQALPQVTPVLRDGARLLHALQPGVRLLGPSSRRLADAIETGVPVLRRATELSDRLGETLGAVGELARAPSTGGALRELTGALASLADTLRYDNPFQVRCNYLGLWTRNADSTISEGDENGNWFRTVVINQPAESFQSATPAPQLHVVPYPRTGQDGQCEAGNEPYLPGQRIGNLAGPLPGKTQDTAPPPGVGP